MRRTSERLGDLVFANAHGARLIPIQYDLELGDPGREELRDQAIRVAQSGDAGLNDQIDRRAVLEQARPHQIQPGTHIDDYVFEVLPRH